MQDNWVLLNSGLLTGLTVYPPFGPSAYQCRHLNHTTTP